MAEIRTFDGISLSDDVMSKYFEALTGIARFIWVDGTINNQTGGEGSTPGQWVHTSNYYDVEYTKTYRLLNNGMTSVQLHEYDENGNWIRYFGSIVNNIAYTPTDSSVKKIKLCCRSNTTRTYPEEGYSKIVFYDETSLFFSNFFHKLSNKIMGDAPFAQLKYTHVSQIPDNTIALFSDSTTETAVPGLPEYGVPVTVVKFQPLPKSAYSNGYSLALAMVSSSPTRYYIGRISTSGNIYWNNLFDDSGEGYQWYGRSWYAYGTSMTEYTDKTLSNGVQAHGYAYYLPNMSGLSLHNRGLGGSGIIPSKHGGLAGDNVYTRVKTLADGKANADLITLEILPNDGTDAIGTVTDVWDEVEGSSTETLMGCLANLLKYLQENTTAQIVVLIATPGRYPNGNPSDPTYPEELISWTDRVELVKQKCALYQVPVISATDGCGLGFWRVGATSTQYVGDQIHLVAAGGYNLAKFFWSRLKDIPNFYTDAE